MKSERTRMTDEYLGDCMNILGTVIDICNEVKNNGMGFSNACALKGLDAVKVRHMLLKNIPGILNTENRNKSVPSDIYDGYEKFYHAVFYTKDMDLPYDYKEAVNLVFTKLKLDDRDEKIVRHHLGISPYEYPASFFDTGTEFKISGTCAEQICNKVYRKARSKECHEILVYGPEKYTLMMEQAKERQKAEITVMMERQKAEMAAIKEESRAGAETFQDKQENKIASLRTMLETKKVTDLRLSARSHNALYRAGITDIYTLLMFSDNISEKIRNCGKISAEEINNVLREWVLGNCAGMSLETVKKCLVMESDSIDYEKLRMELENQLLAGSGEWPYLTTNLAKKGIVTVADMFRLTNAEIWQLADSSMKGWTITAVRTARSMFAASYGMTEEMMIGIVKDQIK